MSQSVEIWGDTLTFGDPDEVLPDFHGMKRHGSLTWTSPNDPRKVFFNVCPKDGEAIRPCWVILNEDGTEHSWGHCVCVGDFADYVHQIKELLKPPFTQTVLTGGLMLLFLLIK
jgi:hypothetical protein